MLFKVTVVTDAKGTYGPLASAMGAGGASKVTGVVALFETPSLSVMVRVAVQGWSAAAGRRSPPGQYVMVGLGPDFVTVCACTWAYWRVCKGTIKRYHKYLLLLHFMICHSNKCHRPRTSSCHKEQRGGTEYG